ncbi:kelch domain-containing protein 4-like [Babylonia areolata]|uniref:kelch domain-containing protein 4-like n=1 Tax=Babylonia areolata TaxID=304850 RepID=UPI003FD56874
MGKKNKDKKGKGKEKTEQKTEKKAAKRAKKELAEKGEDDIEKMIAEFVEKDKQLTQIREEKCSPPSPRSNMTLVAHPDRDELIMFGGEYYTGKNMYLYNDLFFYNIRKNEWSKVTSPNAPPPRSAHQAVMVAAGGGQMWVFGGEFSSHSQNQFYHYRDLWVLHLRDKTWEQFKSPGKQGPSARSGHRMVAFKNQLILFGGFHNNNRDCKYYNDVWAFDLSSYAWSQLAPVGAGPGPRSGCILCPTLTGSRLLVYGGYSLQKVKRDVDQGTAHTDMFALQPEGKGEDGRPAKWRWLPVKQSGNKPSARSSMSAVVAPGNHAVVFGGVEDEEEDEEQLDGTFYNDMFTLDLDKGHWYSVHLRGSKQAADKKRRRKVKQGEDDSEDTMEVDDEEDDDMDSAESTLENLALSSAASADSQEAGTQNPESSTPAGAEGGVFTVTIGPQSEAMSGVPSSSGGAAGGEVEKLFVPCPRMSPCLAVKAGVLYLYGGKFEVGDREFTLCDFHCLDLSKLDAWKTIIAQDVQSEAWEDSDSDSDTAGGGGDDQERKTGRKRGAMQVDDDSDDDDDEDDEELTFDDAPARQEEETQEDYFSRTQDYWLQQARDIMEGEGIKLSDRKLLKIAKEICQEASSK